MSCPEKKKQSSFLLAIHVWQQYGRYIHSDNVNTMARKSTNSP